MHADKQDHDASQEANQHEISQKEDQLHSNEPTQCRFSDSKIIQKNAKNDADVKTPNHTGMPDRLKSGLENLSGYDLSPVRVRYNSPKPKQIGALAYTQGTNIHIGPGQQKHLPHEGWHVVQQMQGRVKPTLQMKGNFKINDHNTLEREADAYGTKAIQLKKNNNHTSLKNRLVCSKVAQGIFDSDLKIEKVEHLIAQYPEEMEGLKFGEKRTIFEALKSVEQVYEADHISKAIRRLITEIADTPKTSSPLVKPPIKSESDPLAGYTKSTASIVVFRADNRPPGEIKQTNGFLQKENMSFSSVMGLLREWGPREFAQDHVSNNRGYFVSLAGDEECGGYANSRYVYKFDFGTMAVFTPPKATSKIMEKPILFANADSLESASLVAMDPRKDTLELDFFSSIPLKYVVSCQGPRGGGFHELDWSKIASTRKPDRPNISDITDKWTPNRN